MTTPGDIKFTGQHFEISDTLKELTSKKINKNILKHYKKYCTGIIEVIMKKNTDEDQIAEMNVHVQDVVLNATASSTDMYQSVDDMIRKMEVQLEKYKGKHLGHQQ